MVIAVNAVLGLVEPHAQPVARRKIVVKAMHVNAEAPVNPLLNAVLVVVQIVFAVKGHPRLAAITNLVARSNEDVKE